MSKPAFSRRRKGKEVDAYPIGKTGDVAPRSSGGKTQSRKPRGRPRRPKREKLKLKEYAFDMGGGYVVARNREEAVWIIENGGVWQNVILHDVHEVGDADPKSAFSTGTDGIRFYLDENGKRLKEYLVPDLSGVEA